MKRIKSFLRKSTRVFQNRTILKRLVHVDCWNLNGVFTLNFDSNFLKNDYPIWETGEQFFRPLNPKWMRKSIDKELATIKLLLCH